MIRMLASVRSIVEARVALAAGVDYIDLKEPSAGALGALSEAALRRVVEFVSGRKPVSATIGDLPCEADALDPAIRRVSACGVDLVKVGVFAPDIDGDVLRVLENRCAAGDRLILVFFAEYWRGEIDFRRLRRANIEGVMMDTADKQRGSLTQRVPLEVLARFVRKATDAGLLAGLAGSLRASDVQRLVSLRPDYLGFRGALCASGKRDADIDAGAVTEIRNLLGRATVGPESAARTAA